MSYLGRSAKLSLKAQEKVSFLATAGQTVKTGLSYTPSFVEVYVNGVLLTDTTDFTATNGNSITFTVALLLNDEVTVISLKTFTVADHYTKSNADTLLAAKATNTAVALKAPIASPVFTGNVGIGGTPASELQVEHAGGGGLTLKTSGGGNFARFTRMASGDTTNGDWSLEHSSKALVFKTNAASGSYASPSWINAMSINSAGIVTKPLQPAFFAYPNSNQSNISTGTSTIVLNAERFDQGGDFNTGTSTFTAPVTGKYQFNLNIRIGSTLDTAANFYRSQIITSNSDYYPTIMSPQFTADTNYWHLTFSVLADMDAGDTAYTRVEQNGGSVQTTIDGGYTSTNFSGFLVA